MVDVLCAPERVVVVGSSSDLTRVSARPLRYLLEYGFAGEIVIVSRTSHIDNIRCVPSIDIIEPVDRCVAIVSLPAAAVPKAARQLADIGVAAAVVIAAGFESDDSIPRADLLAILSDSSCGMRLIGPNCVGTMSTSESAYLTFSSVLRSAPPAAGRVGLVTQSGALGNGLLMSLIRRRAGIAHWFSTGDELDIGALEVTAGMLERADVDCVGLFLEGITDQLWLDEMAKVISRTGKSVYLLKAARTGVGRAAAGGHTGRIVGSSEVTSVVLAAAGVVEVPDLATLADCLLVQQICGRPRLGAGIGVVSISGASAVIAADRINESRTLTIADVSPETMPDIAQRLDARLHLSNPLDVPFLDETSVFAATINLYRQCPTVDAVIAVESSLAHDRGELTRLLGSSSDARSVPVVLCHLSEDDPIDEPVVLALNNARVAVVPTVDRAVLALSLCASQPGLQGEHSIDNRSFSVDPEWIERAADAIGLEAAKELLPGVAWAEWQVLTTVHDAVTAAERFGYPLVLKAAGRVITHRSDVGAVRVARTAPELEQVYNAVASVCHNLGDAVVAQSFAPEGGSELLVSAFVHPEVGPTALIRPGGVLAELMRGQVIISRRWPAATSFQRLLDSEVGHWLNGFRGGKAHAMHAVLELVGSLLEIVYRQDARFLELNPVIVYESDLLVVDAVGKR